MIQLYSPAPNITPTMKTSYSSSDESTPGEDSQWTSGHHSDFSIDFILNEAGPGSRRRLQRSGTPEAANRTEISLGNSPPLDGFAWLQCTRYRPPKLQRNRRKEGRQRRQPGRNPRIPFSAEQVALLEQRFRASQYLGGSEVAKLSTMLCLSDTRVKIWFQNRRARERRERQTNSSNSTNSSPDKQEKSSNPVLGESPAKSQMKILPTSQTSAFMPYSLKLASNSTMDNNSSYNLIKNVANSNMDNNKCYNLIKNVSNSSMDNKSYNFVKDATNTKMEINIYNRIKTASNSMNDHSIVKNYTFYQEAPLELSPHARVENRKLNITTCK
ncbi:homeobox protein engrailed-like ceh-16 [Nilaparvata lugens]|uniref:homeobox protein engrailed-like ceh-16 n=1 Tax=Nilaparvata lugens TaxID=108931 RepID=UPI00193E0B21|nr:homeobox protein engrailed-like ceh-16 [Nilaparvata lugens]